MYILINHIPAKLNISSYGVDKLPVYYKEVRKDYEKLKQFNYLHLLKNRSGEPDVIFPLYNNLEYFALDEIKRETFTLYLNEFEQLGRVTVNLS